LSRSAAGNFNPWLVAVVVSMATFMEVLDTSIANVSLQHIAGNLAAGEDESAWVLTSYLVSNAVILPISGWLSLVVGRKRFYMLCVGLFGASSLACGLAPSLSWLVFFRVLQGLGGGGLAPSEQSILADSFSPEQRGQAFALYGIAVVFAPTMGPTLGGWITDNFSWRWIFFINIPVCVLSLILSWRILVDPPAVKLETAKAIRKGMRVDWLGFIFVAVGLGCLQVVLDKGQEDDWFHSDFIVIFAVASAVSLAALVVWESFQDEPIVDIPLFADRNFGPAALVMFFTGFMLLSTTQLLPQFLQRLMGYNATNAGLALTAGGLATLVTMPVVGYLVRRVQPKYLIGFGLIVEAAALFHLETFTTGISFSHVAWARVFQGIGFPFLFVPITTVAYAGLPPEKNANAAALINTMRNLGASFGISLTGTVLIRRGQFHHSRLGESFRPFATQFHAHGAKALALLDRTVGLQAQMLSYIDVFRMLAVIAVFVIPFTFLLRRVDPNQPGAH